MKRRHFLRLGGTSLLLSTLPSFGFANTGEPVIYIPDALKHNPLLNFGALPDFPAIKPEHIEPAIKFLMEACKNTIETLSKQPKPTWKNFYQPLEELEAYQDFSWSIVSRLNGLVNTPEIRKAYDAARKHRSDFSSWYGMNEEVYACFKRLKASAEYRGYNQAQKRAIDEMIKTFERSGVGLPADKKERLAKITDRLGKVRSQFSNNILDANKWSITLTDPNAVLGIPESDLKAAKDAAAKAGETGYRFVMSDANIRSILESADNRELREKFYRAYETRASEMADDGGKYDNTANINEILALQYERARLLGYKNYAHFALDERMAKSPEEVMQFYQAMIGKVLGIAKTQIETLKEYGKNKLGITDPQAWDFRYIANKRKAELYEFDQERLRPYLPIDKVLAGLFEVNRRLFGITIKERKGVAVWHPSVRFFDFFDEKGEHIGSTYADFYAREGKRGGASKSNLLVRRKDAQGKIIKPLTVLVCNFTPPSDGVSLLTQSNVVTLFHEFGHVVHQLISKIDVAAVTGTAIPRDAVEFPSQFMEYYTQRKEAMPLFSGHYQTGEPLPADLVEKANAASDYLMAYNIIRQIEDGFMDIRLYNEYDPNDANFVQRIYKEVQDSVSVIDEPDYVRSLHTFSHIFTGSYAAGYYGYLWSDVLSADVFSRFEKVGIFDRKTGKAYVDKFLAQGGSKDVMTMYVDFMGRKPRPEAFMARLDK